MTHVVLASLCIFSFILLCKSVFMYFIISGISYIYYNKDKTIFFVHTQAKDSVIIFIEYFVNICAY